MPAGNPKGIHTLEDLSGKSVAVQLGTTNKDALDAANDALMAAGKPPIDIQTFQQDTDGFQQLALGRVDAFSTDSPVVAYYNSLPGERRQVRGRRHADRARADRDRRSARTTPS